jgi:hypothetical protein
MDHQRQDPRIGRRVVDLSHLPHMVMLGTIREIESLENGKEYWTVLLDDGVTHEGQEQSFSLYNGPEFTVGDQVRYKIDEGGYWEAVVLRPFWISDLSYIIRITDSSKAAVPALAGEEINAHPTRLTKI